MEGAGLVVPSQTLMNGVIQIEYQFMPAAAEFVAPFFK
jgi:hypothetical protein